MDAYPECSFSINWEAEGVKAMLCIPVATTGSGQAATEQASLAGNKDIRLCFFDDQPGPRAGVKKLVRLVYPSYSPPEEARHNKYVWEDDLVKVAGTRQSQIEE